LENKTPSLYLSMSNKQTETMKPNNYQGVVYNIREIKDEDYRIRLMKERIKEVDSLQTESERLFNESLTAKDLATNADLLRNSWALQREAASKLRIFLEIHFKEELK